MTEPVTLVVGVGPGIGGALARRFGRAGHRVAALGRDLEKAVAVAEEVGPSARAYACDATDEASVTEALEAVRSELGAPSYVLYNAGSGVFGGLDEIGPAEVEAAFRVNVLGLLHVVRGVAPSMRAAGRGVIGVTGATASLRGRPSTLAFAAAKAGQRSLAQSLARELGPAGLHVFYVIIDGVVDLPISRAMMANRPADSFIGPDDVAETFFALASQPRSAWTFEADLRPFGESW